MNNSSSTWNHLHLGYVSDQQTLSVFTAGLTNNSLQTMRLRVELYVYDDELLHTFFQTSLIYNIQEFYCDMKAQPSYIHLFRLPRLKILHLKLENIDDKFTDFNDLEKCIEMNSSIKEMKFICIKKYGELVISAYTSVIRGVTKNNTITSLTLVNTLIRSDPPPLPDGVIEQLLKDNNTLQALSINVRGLLPSSLSIQEEEIHTPLKALEIRGWGRSHELMTSLLPHIKGLHCLILPHPFPPHRLLLSHPTLHTLSLLYTAESAIELFTILRTNTTLKALRVWIWEEGVYTSSALGTSLQDMLAQNQTLKYLQINNKWDDNPISSSFLSFLTTGLIHNTSLQQLRVPITLMPINNEEIRTFINVISQKNNLTELQVYFRLDQSYSNCSREEKEQIMTSLYYEQALPAVTNMLQSHTTIRILGICCMGYLNESSQPNGIELVQHLYETIFIHLSLEYIKISIHTKYSTVSLLKGTLKGQKMTLIERHRKEQPHRPIPTVVIEELM